LEESTFRRGQESKQSSIQAERESRELAPAYFAFSQSIPDNPEEAPTELMYDDSMTPLIPFDEIVEGSVLPPQQQQQPQPQPQMVSLLLDERNKTKFTTSFLQTILPCKHQTCLLILTSC
jgi:hypothetical protein